MKTRMVCLLAVGIVAALAVTGWASDKESAQALTSTMYNPEYVGSSAPRAAWPGPDGFGYTGSSCTYSWVDISGTGTVVAGLSDDNFVGPLAVGFTFPLYTSSWTDFYVGSNGFLTFGAGSSLLSNVCLPDVSAPPNIVALMWDDLYPPAGGTVYYQSFASCPVGSGQCLVVQFTNMVHYSTGSAGTWEAILFDSGVVRMQFLDAGIEGGSGSTTGIGGANVAADHGLTYACNAPGSLTANLCIEIGMLPSVLLSPDPLDVTGCAGAPQTHTLSLFNNTGADGTFDMTYAVTVGDATLTGPAEVTATAGATVPFDVVLNPALAAGAQTVTATVTATGNSYTDTATINKTVMGIGGGGVWTEIATEPNGFMDNVVGAYDGKIWSVTGYFISGSGEAHSYDPTTDSWTTIAGSAAPWGAAYPRSGCFAGDEVFIYGDAVPTFSGLWSYDISDNVWTSETPTGTPPPYTGIWAPSWVADPATGYCYMTGGATMPGAGNLTSVYVYDPATNAWLAPLPNFTSIRDFHAAYIFTRPADSHKLLCVAGGNNTNGMTSTQCYDFTTAAWNAENADLGTTGMGDIWGMGYSQKTTVAGDQLWMTGGIIAGSAPSSATWYYDVATSTWVDGGLFPTAGVYRTAAATLDNEVYQLGGSTGGFTPTGLADRNLVCTAPDNEIFADGFETGDTSLWSLVQP